MTEKRFQYNVNKNSIEYNEKHFAYCNGEQNKIANKLNKLAEKNQNLQFLIIEMLDFIKENDGVTRQEMSDWWNKKVMSE